MKKLLLGSAAVALGLAIAAPAKAQGITLDIGGHMKGYMAYVDQDDGSNGESARELDILRETEIFFTGETTLDNGLTVGFHTEANTDDGDNFDVEETYAYFSGQWGRVNFGAEDGAAYLLQVAAPSADSNYDGLRQYVTPFNYFSGFAVGLDNTTITTSDGDQTFSNLDELFNFDYDQDVSGYDDKLTYLTPVMNGFQAGVSYTPELDSSSNSLDGVNRDDELADYGAIYDVAMRYEGQFDNVGFTFGAGYTHADLEEDTTIFYDADGSGTFNAGDTLIGDLDDRKAWNVGLDLDVSAFGFGVAYTEDDLGFDGDSDRKTWVFGADYTTGPFKLGASYYMQDQEIGDSELETDRYTGGVVYTYGPGMTFRGSVSHIEHEIGTEDADGTSLMLGTQINF